MRSSPLGHLVLVTLAFSRPALAQETIPYSDQMMQAPQLDPPSRGSVAGQYASVAFGPGEVDRGTFALPLPITLPSDRGAIGASPIPSYSADGALSEWGAGWSSPNLTILRSRVFGDLDYSTDERTGPWGRMLKGTDGAWYPDGMKTPVRVVESGANLVAYLPDGAVWTFSGALGITTPPGTYSWQLATVVSALGRTTTYNYATNASGRAFLESITYGGTDVSTPQYQITFDYATLPLPLVDYRSGTKVLLDRRVTVVHAQSLDNGVFAERHTWSLGYQQDPTSPTFYLQSLTQTFAASGQTAPAVEYVTELAATYFGSVTAQPVPKFTPLLSRYGLGLPQPNMSSQVDVDLDGLTDLETQYDNTLLHQTASGYTAEALAAPSGPANPLCRRLPSLSNAPRTLARMVSGSDALHVVGIQASTTGGTTAVAFCDRPGNTLWQPKQPLSGNWTLGPNTRLVDLNRDFAPDLLRVYPGGYVAIPNESTQAGYGLGSEVTGSLTPVVQVNTTWVHDLNGDGIADILSRWSGGIVAWLGKGHLQYDPTGIVLPVLTASGQGLPALTAYQFVFFDANNDGITDLLLSNGSTVLLFANSGTSFKQVAMPVFTSSTWSNVKPVILDSAGNGNTEITYVQGGVAYAVDLDAPGVGLLHTANDGRGTVVSFGYQRAPADVGVRYRNSLLSSLQVASTGYDPITYNYSFSGPEVHSVGRFLLGYDEVQRRDALGLETHTTTFSNTDDAPSMLLTDTDRDALEPNVLKVKSRTYAATALTGVPWMQLQSESQGWSTPSPATTPASMLETTQYTYGSGVCPSQIVKTSSAGTLTTSVTYDTELFPNALSCVDQHATMVGRHADSTLDFQHEAQINRNAAGLVTNVTMFQPATGNASGTPLDLQDVTYNPDWTVQTISRPGRGMTTYAFAGSTGLLASVADPVGVVTAVTRRDPLSDAVDELTVNRGGLLYQRDFTFDGLERLAASWNNLGAASAAVPDETNTYRYASGSMPALIQTATLATLAQPSGAPQPVATYAQAAGIFTADAKDLGTATLIPQGWTFAHTTQRSRATRTDTTFVNPTVADVTALDMTALYSGATPTGVKQASLFGFAAAQSTTYQANVTRSLADSLGLDASGAERAEVENGALSTTWTRDEESRVTRYVDQAGTPSGYVYDALGRLRRVALPDGTRHAITYNDYAQVTQVVRDNVATLTFTYDATSGLVSERDVVAPAGTASAGTVWARTAYQYDTFGRLGVESDVDTASGASESHQYFYDGATPSTPTANNALGLLTAVATNGYSRTMSYRADGVERSRVVTIDGWRTIETDLLFDEDGTPSQSTLTVSDASGNVLYTDVTATTRDAYGRLSALSRDGAPFASYAYDASGLPLTASFAGPYSNGEVATIAYDPTTRLKTGMSQSNASWSAGISQVLNARGLVDAQNVSVSSLSLSRAFQYTPQGFLAQSSDSAATYAYQYAADGQPSQIASTVGGAVDTRTFARSGNVLTAGTHQQTFDDVGRVVQRDGVNLVYGGSGQIAAAQGAASEWSYLYDETGNRVAKLVGGVPVAAYLPDGTYVDASSVTTPVRFGKQLVALLHGTNGAPATKTIALVAADLTGTVQSDEDGTPRIGSPFGDRAVHPDLAAAIDYAEKNYDADLGTVRMGVRDYDPSVSRFLTPDPLFLEHLDKCIGDPVDCTLYAYARNNPLLVIDPSGTWGFTMSFNASDPIPFEGGSAGAGAEGGALIDVTKGTYQYYLTVSGAAAVDCKLPPGLGATPASAGAKVSFGGGVSYVPDPSQFAGSGFSVQGQAWYFTASGSFTSDGNFNGVGLGGGFPPGLSFSITPTYTVVSAPKPLPFGLSGSGGNAHDPGSLAQLANQVRQGLQNQGSPSSPAPVSQESEDEGWAKKDADWSADRQAAEDTADSNAWANQSAGTK